MKTIQQRSRQLNHPLHSYELLPYKNPFASNPKMSPPSHPTHYCSNDYTDLSRCPKFQMRVRLTTMATEESILEKAREENRLKRSSGPSRTQSWAQPPPYKRPLQRPGAGRERELSRTRSSRSSFEEGQRQQQQSGSWQGGEGPQKLQARQRTPSTSKRLLASLLPQESSRAGHGLNTKVALPASTSPM